jgi:hypothetical protein
MSDTRPILSRPELETQRTSAARTGAPRTEALPGGVAFQALIEKLETQARELERETSRVESPADLAGAVDRAQASLAGALELSERLLEAFHASRQRPETPTVDPRP